jgi:hypothetical protein
MNLHEDTCYDSDPASATDSGDDYCFWYNDFPGSCGLYDDDDFNASEFCCACGGGSSTNNDMCYTDTAYGESDSFGDACDWYDSNPGSCGVFDTDYFSAEDMCCSCGGGYRQGQCYDTNYGAGDATDDGCWYYDENPTVCGWFDDWDFDAVDMCCSCGGGTGGGQSDALWYSEDWGWLSLSAKATPKQKQYAVYALGAFVALALIGYAIHASKKKEEVKTSQVESLISTPQVY